MNTPQTPLATNLQAATRGPIKMTETDRADMEPVFRQAATARAATTTHPAETGFSGKLIVAVHGMGDQTRNDFAQTVGRLFARHYTAKSKMAHARLLPLGAWDGGRETDVDDPAISYVVADDECQPLEDFAFAEIHWADIARTMENHRYRLEEATHWARSVVGRLGQRHGHYTGLGPEQFHLAAYVVEQISETLALLQKIAAAGKLFKLSKKDVDTVLTQYLCDVQQVGDYPRQREKMRDRFFNRMEFLHEKYPQAEIHIVAHSEGTVVSLFSLLTAFCQEGRGEVEAMRHARMDRLDPSVKQPRTPKWDWVDRLASFSTMGSPIDKHLHLWPEMWRAFETSPTWLVAERKIRWRNYYDYADPVGYELDSAQAKLALWKCEAFQFDTSLHDHGFRRYPLPGQAHLGYFTDDDLFRHIIHDAILGEAHVEKVQKLTIRGVCSPVIPFGLVLGLLFGAVFVLHRALLPPEGEAAVIFDGPWMQMAQHNSYGLFGCWAMLVGVTVAARILRLTRTWVMFASSAALLTVCIWAFWYHPGRFALEAGYRWGGWWLGSGEGVSGQEIASKQAFVGWSVILAAFGWAVDYIACKLRWRPVWGIRILMAAGTLMLGIMLVVPRIKDSGNESAWTLLGGLAGFGVLWWLGTLLFDLAFCWQRYINTGKSWMNRVWPGIEASSDRKVPPAAKSDRVRE